MFRITGPYPSRPHALFDSSWYEFAYPDTLRFKASPWLHFVRHGDREGRDPGPGFDAHFYRRTYMSLADQGASRCLAHYIQFGQRRGLLPRAMSRTLDQSADAVRAVSLGENVVVLIGNDAQRAGAPILLLELARRLGRRGYAPIFVLQRGGPLLEEYRELGRTFIVDEGWDVHGLGTGISPTALVIANTAWGAQILREMRREGPQTLLIHEMPDYIRAHGLSDSLGVASDVVSSFPVIQQAIAGWVREPTRHHLVMMGLLPAKRQREERLIAERLLKRAFGISRTVYVGAGYADRRKGFDLFLDAANQISHRNPHAAFIWLGEADEWARALADEAIANGLRLVLPGFRQYPAEWYALADAYLLTSRSDPGPTTVMDAALMGVPFVGYAGDIGLQNYQSELRGIGDFFHTQSDFVDQALAIVETESPEKREERANSTARFASFDSYCDEVLRISMAALGHAPVRMAPMADRIEAKRTRRRRNRKNDDRIAEENFVFVRIYWRLLRVWDERPYAYPIVAVQPNSAPANKLHGAVRETQRVLKTGSKTWLATLAALTGIRQRVAVHIGRSDQEPGWETVTTLQQLGTVAVLSQFDSGNPPEWVTEKKSPPPILFDRSHFVAQPSFLLRPAPRMELARPIGVFVHAFHVDVAPQLFDRISLIDHPVRIYVSTDTLEKAQLLREMAPDATIRVLENRGQDIYPKLYGFRDVYDEHDVVLHLHAKKSTHSPSLHSWLGYILDQILPSRAGIDSIVALFQATPDLGIVGPIYFPPIVGSAGWGPNRPIAEAMVWGRGWDPLPNNDQLQFPAGSMFWARTQALQPLLALDIPADVFLPASPRLDGSVSHAIERLYGPSCNTAGLRQIFVSAYADKPIDDPVSVTELGGTFGP